MIADLQISDLLNMATQNGPLQVLFPGQPAVLQASISHID